MAGNFTVPTWRELEATLDLPVQRGTYGPAECLARQKVAVIIPYRDRVAMLKVILRHLHPLLQRQQAHYGIYVIEQVRRVVITVEHVGQFVMCWCRWGRPWYSISALDC